MEVTTVLKLSGGGGSIVHIVVVVNKTAVNEFYE